MRCFAEQRGYDSEFWGIVGLLHDIDFEQWPEQHCVKAPELLREGGADESIIHAVCSHGWAICVDIKPEHEMEKLLYAADELTGLIGAAALMRPSKSVQDMELKSLKVVKEDVIKSYLMKTYHIPDYQADVCAAFSQGNVGKAIQLASSEEFGELKASVLQLMKRLEDIDLYEMTAAVKQIAEYKLTVNDYFDLMMIWFRDVLYMKATNDVNGLIFKDEVYDIKKQAAKRSYQGIETIIRALETAKVRISANVNFDLVIELLLLTIKEN